MSDLKLAGDSEPVSEFLHYLYDGLEGFAYAPILERSVTGDKQKDKFFQRWFEWPAESNEMRDWILSRQAENDVYVAPAIFKTPTLDRHNFKASNVVWTEFDGNTPTNTGEVPAPTFRVQSSSETFQHWYWKLRTPITDLSTLEGINRSITYTLAADASSWDATQILRPVGTTNHKRGLPVQFISSSLEQYESTIFSSLEVIAEPHNNFELEEIPDVSTVILAYSFPADVIELFRTKEFPVGNRSSALMRLGYSCAEMGMTDGEIFAVLRNADDRWKKFSDRADRDRRLIDLINKARLKHPEILDIQEDVIPLLGFQTFLDSEIEIEWLIPGVLQHLGYFLLTGPAGVGKTQYSLQWAIHLALGKDYLGHEVNRPMRILFMSLEMGFADLKYFASLMAASLSEMERAQLEQNLIMVPLGEPFYIDSDKGQKKFEAILDVVRPEVFMWDSIGSATASQLSDESTVKSIMDFNDRVRQKYQITSWFIHHNRKATSDNKKPNKMSDVYGNQYLVNRATSIYCLWPSGPSIEVIPLKKRLSAVEKPWNIVRNETDLSFYRKENVAGLTSTDNPDDVLNPKVMTDKDLSQDIEPPILSLDI